MTICVDVSNWDYPTFEAAEMKAAGVDRMIVGCQDPWMARVMISRARAAGIEVIGVYAYIYFDRDTIGQTQAAIDVAQECAVPTGWIDVEDTEYGTPVTRAEQVRDCVNHVEMAGLRVGIYTGGWYWPSYMGNTTEFAHLPLWHSAYWDDHREVREVAYGGWTKVAIHQYTSTLYIAGRNRDANYVFEEEHMGMTPAETERIERIERVLAEWSGAGTLAMLDTKNVSIYGSLLNQNEALNALIAAGVSANRDDDKTVVAAALRKAAEELEK